MKTRSIVLLCLLAVAAGVCFYGWQPYPAPQSIVSWTKGKGFLDHSSRWHRIKGIQRLKGVALVIHGLNLKPERMQPIISELNRAGIDVLNVSLKGHGENFARDADLPLDEARLESFRRVTFRLWLDEVRDGYLKAAARAAKKKVPLFLIGYSLGGLMSCDLILSYPDVLCDRMVLFAPALNITAKSYLLKALLPFPNMVIDSLSPVSYRANEGTPMAAYKALFEAVDYFEQNADGRLNRPTVIIIDEKDEFISSSELAGMIARKNLDQWRILPLKKDPAAEGRASCHLIIDKASVGEETWRLVRSALTRHLAADR